ncbi:Microtubule-associated futsch-like protein [Hirschfeldia incana]|nr:Microtubule-associated futsch-like protein [Hirschfeldia incana]
MEKSTEKSVSSVASGNSINSKLRYPLRSALRSKEGKPPVPDFSSGSSAPRRGRVASAVSQSTTVLDLSAKKSVGVDRAKPPRRMSIPNKTSSNSSVRSVSSSVTSLSETKAKRPGGGYSNPPRSLNVTPVSSVTRSGARRRVEDLSSSAYWMAHIKLAESVEKHSISLGFFKLALHAGCEPLEKMKEELKSYAARNNMDGLADAVKELSELYCISEESKPMQKVSESETSSVVAEETTVSLKNDGDDVQSSLSTPVASNITSEITKEDDVSQDSAVMEEAKEEEVSESIQQERTRRSLDVINVNEAVVPEAVQGSEVGAPKVAVAQPSEKKRASRKETVSKNSLPVKTKKAVATTNSVNPRAVPENKDNKPQKKPERITKPRTKKVQEETKKSTKKPAAKEGEEVKSLKQMDKMENKENSVVAGAGEEIQV